MPKTRQEKEVIVNELSDKFGRIQTAVFTQVSGYTMEDANALREKGAEQGVECLIAKKTLLMRALENGGFKVAKDDFSGSILTSLGYEDQVSAAKLMSEFAKGREEITVVGGILEGEVVGPDAILKLSTLPSRDELLAKLVGSINAPVSGFVNALAGNLRNIVYVLNAVKDSKSA